MIEIHYAKTVDTRLIFCKCCSRTSLCGSFVMSTIRYSLFSCRGCERCVSEPSSWNMGRVCHRGSQPPGEEVAGFLRSAIEAASAGSWGRAYTWYLGHAWFRLNLRGAGVLGLLVTVRLYYAQISALVAYQLYRPCALHDIW